MFPDTEPEDRYEAQVLRRWSRAVSWRYALDPRDPDYLDPDEAEEAADVDFSE